MSENVEDVRLSPKHDPRTFPPSPSPSPEANELVEQILSKKREREVSLEPTTPKTSVVADVKSPAKKGRLHLDTTFEEEDVRQRSRSRTPSQPHSPALSVSPPHEVKVRQISQGVEDMNWKQQGSFTQNHIHSSTGNLEVSDKGDDQAAAQQETYQSVEHPIPPLQEASTEVYEAEDVPSSLPSTGRASDSEGIEPDKGLKRKLADRGTSQGPEGGLSSPLIATSTAETAKRPRDDGDKDLNPRVPKRASPPPEQKKPLVVTETSTPKLGGFMAYVSTASPFASVKGQNIFSSTSHNNQFRKPPTPPIVTPVSLLGSSVPNDLPCSPLSVAALSQQSSPQQTLHSTATKRTGFEAFSGSASPSLKGTPALVFARSKSLLGSSSKITLARSKSPPRRPSIGKNAGPFSSYASGGAQAFAIPIPKRARAESPSGDSSTGSLERKQCSGPGVSRSNESSASGEEEDSEKERKEPTASSFGERLRCTRDIEEGYSEEREGLPVQQVLTGEEEEETIHQVRGKIYVLCPQNQWKERGTGQLRLNVRRVDGGGARLVMRKEGVFAVLLNVKLFPGMKCFIAQDPRYIRFSTIEEGYTTHYNLRVSNAKIAQELLEEIYANIPS